MKAKSDAPDEFLELLALDLGIALDDVVFDEPSLELRVGPAIPNMPGSIVIVVLHTLSEGRTRGRNVVVGVDTVFIQPFILRDGE